MITKEKAVLVLVDNPIPVAFFNLYDEGDIWVKIKGCESCSLEQRIKCCGNCPCITPTGDCYWQSPAQVIGSHKPFYCITNPVPTKHNSRCCIEYKCIEGAKKDKIRRLKDKLNVFVD